MKEVLIRQTKRASEPQRAVSLMCDCSRSECLLYTNTDQRRDGKQVQSLQDLLKRKMRAETDQKKHSSYIFWVITCSISKIAAWMYWIKSSESFLWSEFAGLSYDITKNELLNNRQQNQNMFRRIINQVHNHRTQNSPGFITNSAPLRPKLLKKLVHRWRWDGSWRLRFNISQCDSAGYLQTSGRFQQRAWWQKQMI